MKILAFSDLHRDCDAAREIVSASAQADILIGTGDFSTQGEGAAETLEILRRAGKPLVIVPGNHDNPLELRKMLEGWENCYYLHGDSVELGGNLFFGLGLEIPQRSDFSWNTVMSEADAAESLASCPRRCVLLTHTPPFGHADLQRDGTHEGSQAITKAIEDKNPKLVLCGHVHSAWGMSSKLNETIIYNLGPALNWFQI